MSNTQASRMMLPVGFIPPYSSWSSPAYTRFLLKPRLLFSPRRIITPCPHGGPSGEYTHRFVQLERGGKKHYLVRSAYMAVVEANYTHISSCRAACGAAKIRGTYAKRVQNGSGSRVFACLDHRWVRATLLPRGRARGAPRRRTRAFAGRMLCGLSRHAGRRRDGRLHPRRDRDDGAHNGSSRRRGRVGDG